MLSGRCREVDSRELLEVRAMQVVRRVMQLPSSLVVLLAMRVGRPCCVVDVVEAQEVESKRARV